MAGLVFDVIRRDGAARIGRIVTRRGVIDTPAFMPVGTHAAVKGVTPEELTLCGAQIILSNTYHVFLRPGHDAVRSLGGLHGFMGWHGPILTDSGGFQAMSMCDLTRFEEQGVHFKSHLTGDWHLLTPELSMEIQTALGSDVVMVLDVCPELPASREVLGAAVERTTRWAARCVESYRGDGAVFGIVQGGTEPDLRERSVSQIIELDLPGYAIGGVSVGEASRQMADTVRTTAAWLPSDRPRYLMGVGTPADLVEAVGAGIDMFDCVMPTRNARNGTLFTSGGKINIKRSEFRRDGRPLDDRCTCATCRHHSRAYLRHLFVTGDVLASRLNTIHNLTFYLDLMRRLRAAVADGRYEEFRRRWIA